MNLKNSVFSPFKALSHDQVSGLRANVNKFDGGFKNHKKEPELFDLWCRLIKHVVDNQHAIYSECRFEKGNFTPFAIACMLIINNIYDNYEKTENQKPETVGKVKKHLG